MSYPLAITATRPKIKGGGGNSSSVHIAYDLAYSTDADEVKFYLVDKSASIDESAKTMDFANGTELKPLNATEKAKYNIVFSAKTNISGIKAKTPPSFNPTGTFILFDATVATGKATTVTVKSDCFDIDGKIDLISGMSKATEEASKTFTATRGDQDKSIYGAYVIGRNKTNGKIVLTESDGTTSIERSFSIPSSPSSPLDFFTQYNMKFVNLSVLQKENGNNYFATEWSNTSNIAIDYIEGNNMFARYCEKGTDNWKEIRFRDAVNIQGLDPAKTYELRLYGINAVYFAAASGTGAATKDVKITHWGAIKWKTFSGAFANCTKLDVTADDSPDMTNVTNCNRMFAMCSNLVGTEQMGKWDVSHVTNMSAMFYGAQKFNQNLNNWNVSNVTNMGSMFQNAVLFNQPLNNWVVAKVTSMINMFNGASQFNQNINDWTVSNVMFMNGMFSGAVSFNQPLDQWNVSNVTNMGSMFQNAKAFNQPLDKWTVSKVTNMSAMFAGAVRFNQNINDWNVSNVTDMSSMFKAARSFNQPLNKWTVSNVTDMNSMFMAAELFNQDISSWTVSKVTNMKSMFSTAKAFNQPLNNWNVSNVTDMRGMFDTAKAFNQPLDNWVVSNVTNMGYMFAAAENFNQDISKWNVSKVSDHTDMFLGCPLENLTTKQPKFSN